MTERPNIRTEIERQLRRWSLDEDDGQLASVMLAGAIVGANIKRIAKLLRFSRADARYLLGMIRQAGLVHQNEIAAEWTGKDGGLAFMLDLCCVKGLLERSDHD